MEFFNKNANLKFGQGSAIYFRMCLEIISIFIFFNKKKKLIAYIKDFKPNKRLMAIAKYSCHIMHVCLCTVRNVFFFSNHKSLVLKLNINFERQKKKLYCK